MFLLNLIVIYLLRKYGVPLHNFFEKWTRGISYLNKVHVCLIKDMFQVSFSNI